jgi:hypothetical protein
VTIRYDGDDDDRALLRRLDRGEAARASTSFRPAPLSVRRSSGAPRGTSVEYDAPGGTLRVEIVAVGD